MKQKQGKPVPTPIIRVAMVHGMQNVWKWLAEMIPVIPMEIMQIERKPIAKDILR